MKIRILTLIFFICFCSSFSQNDATKALVEKSSDLNLDMWELVDYAKEHIKSDLELARFFYYWISFNIEYDVEMLIKKRSKFYSDDDRRDIINEFLVFEKRKGICAGYAQLYKWFVNELDIENAYVSGYIRDERNHYIELELDANYRHAWNALKINEKWMLVDTTWETSLDATVADYYFDMKPEWAIITHYPKESKWQLLKKPLSLKEFNDTKYIKSVWFFVGFTDIPKIQKDDKYYYFVYRTNPNKNWSVDLKFSIDNINFKSVEEIKTVIQEEYTYLRLDNIKIEGEVFFKVNLKDNSLHRYRDVINFKL